MRTLRANRREFHTIIITSLIFALPGGIFATAMKDVESVAESADLNILNRIKPARISHDLNGDGNADIALFVEGKKSKKQGICIIHSNSNQCVIVGAGNRFYQAGDDFKWVDTWELVPKGEAWETTFKADGDVLGEKKVQLDNAGIRVCVDEGGCGIVTYRQGKYRWVHQAD